MKRHWHCCLFEKINLKKKVHRALRRICKIMNAGGVHLAAFMTNAGKFPINFISTPENLQHWCHDASKPVKLLPIIFSSYFIPINKKSRHYPKPLKFSNIISEFWSDLPTHISTHSLTQIIFHCVFRPISKPYWYCLETDRPRMCIKLISFHGHRFWFDVVLLEGHTS